MARISNYFHLCPINDEEELCGLAPDHSKGTVVNTLGKNIIIIVKVRPPNPFTALAALDPFTLCSRIDRTPFSIAAKQPEASEKLDGHR